MTKLKNETQETFSLMPIISVLPLGSSNGSKVSLSISPHFKCKRLACCVSLASSRILPFCSSAPALQAAVAAAGSAKLALFPTVILSALMQSPFGTAGCHGTRSILPTGTQLEYREWSVWQETSGHEKVQCNDLKREAKFNTRMVEFTRFSLLKCDCFVTRRGGYTDRIPDGVSRMKGMWWNCAEPENGLYQLHAGISGSLMWTCFTSYSQGNTSERTSKVQHPKSNSLPWL